MNTIILFLLNFSLLYGQGSLAPPIQNTETLRSTLCELFPKSLRSECHTKWKKNNYEQIDVEKSKKCFVCNRLVQLVGPNVDTSQKPEEIQKRLLKICEIFSNPLKSTCIKFCTEDGLKIVESLFKAERPGRICEKERYCKRGDKPGKVNVKSTKGNMDLLPNGNKINSGKELSPASCYLCEQIMIMLEKLIDTSYTREQLKAALKEVCWLMPKSQTNECIELIDKYYEAIIDFLLNEESPEKICHLLNICSSGDKKPDETLYFLPKITYGL